MNAALPRPHSPAHLQLWDLVAPRFTAADLHDPVILGGLRTILRGDDPTPLQLAAVRRARGLDVEAVAHG